MRSKFEARPTIEPIRRRQRENTVPCGAAVVTSPLGHFLFDRLMPGLGLPGSRKPSSIDSDPVAGSKFRMKSRLPFA